MTFNEKSAWIMLTALLVSGLSYAGAVANLSADLGQLAPPSVPLLIKFTVLLIVISIVGHALIATLRPGESDDRLDEREQGVHDRAGNWSGIVLGVGVISALIGYLMLGQGDLLGDAGRVIPFREDLVTLRRAQHGTRGKWLIRLVQPLCDQPWPALRQASNRGDVEELTAELEGTGKAVFPLDEAQRQVVLGLAGLTLELEVGELVVVQGAL